MEERREPALQLELLERVEPVLRRAFQIVSRKSEQKRKSETYALARTDVHRPVKKSEAPHVAEGPVAGDPVGVDVEGGGDARSPTL